MMDYSASVVDDTCGDVFGIPTGWSPNGRCDWKGSAASGRPSETSRVSTCSRPDPRCRWAKDIADILALLHTPDDKRPQSTGVVGEAPEFCARGR